MPVGSGSISFVDYDGQTGVFGFNTATINAGNFAAIATAIDTLKAATQAICDGLASQKTMSQTSLYIGSGAKSNVEDSQRGNKWRVNTFDNTAELATGVPNPYYRKAFDYAIPTADLDQRHDQSNVFWILDASNNPSNGDDFVAAFEAVCKSPVGGTLVVMSIEAETTAGG